MKVLGVHVDGGMREFITVPTCLLVKANDLPFEHLAQVEMLAIGAHALTWAQLQSDENILVIGAGPIGLGVMAFAKAQAARVLAMDRSEARLAFVEAHGLAETMSAKGDTVTLLKERFGGELPTTVFDATGSAHSMMDTPDYTAHGGRIVFVGHTRGELTFANPTLHSRELTLHCSRNATEKDFETVIASLRRKAFDLNLWLTHRASLESFIGDFPKWLEPESGVVKAVLEF